MLKNILILKNKKNHKIKFNFFKSNENKLLILNNELAYNSQNKIYNNTLDYISFAKIIACFSVVILHTNGIFWNFNYNIYKKYWKSANLIECIFYFGVPFFVLSIGATLLDFNEKYGLKKYLKRRIVKVVIPLLLWSILQYFFNIYFIKNLKKEKINFVYLWNLFFRNKINPIFWSFHSFLKIYMIIPLIAFVEKYQKIKIYSYCLITLFINQLFIPYIIKFFHLKLVWVYKIEFNLIFYIFSGYIIQNYNFNLFSKIIIYFLGIFGFVIHFLGTQILAIKYKKIVRLHKGYSNLPCILYSCSLFLLIKENFKFLYKIINKNYINKIGSLTIGPFFIHIPLKNTFDQIFRPNKYNISYRLFGGCIICLMCLILTFFLKKIKLLNYLLP